MSSSSSSTVANIYKKDEGKKDHLHKVSSTQTTFLVITQILNVIIIGLGFACLFFFIETMDTNNSIHNVINNHKNITNEIYDLFKNNQKEILTECYNISATGITITAPIVLSDNAANKIQFQNGLKLPGMNIETNKIDLYGSILFNNNLNYIHYADPPSLIQASAMSNFIGQPGLTEIGFIPSPGPQTLCSTTSPIGSNNYPFPSVYISHSGSSGYKLCICMANYVRRNGYDPVGAPLKLALQGTGKYNTPGEYCTLIS